MYKSKHIFILILLLLFAFPPAAAEKSGNFLFYPDGANFAIYGRGTKTYIINQARLTRWKLYKNITKLASAKRINTAADDPAGLAVAEKMTALMQGLKRDAMNDEDYRNYLQYYESAVGQDHGLLQRIRLLILRSSGGILAPEDREINQSEIDQLLDEIDNNAAFARFNRKLVIPGLTVKGLNLTGVNVVTNLYGSLNLVDEAMRKLRKMRAGAGAQQNMLTFRIKGKAYYYVNIMESESRIRDLDMAEEISDLMKNRVLLQVPYGVLLREKSP